MARRVNPARAATPTPAVTVPRTLADLARAIESARARWRKHAPRRFWGLVDARVDPASVEALARQQGK